MIPPSYYHEPLTGFIDSANDPRAKRSGSTGLLLAGIGPPKERNSSMIGKKYVSLIALGACLVGLSVLGSTKNPVTRPSKDVLHETLIITGDFTQNPPLLKTWEIFGTGNSTHLGLMENRGGGTFDEFGVGTGSGIMTAANGDQVFWRCPNNIDTGEIYGGTGRFESATGSFKTVSIEMVPSPDSTLTTVVYDVVLRTAGTMTY
jgi:hypothetical protein